MGGDHEMLIRRSPVDTSHFDPRLARDERAGGEVPRAQPMLVVRVQVAGRDQTQVYGRGPEPSNVSHLRQHLRHDLTLSGPRPRHVLEAGANERLCERRILRIEGLRFRFRYDLVRQVLRETVSPARRRLLRQRLDHRHVAIGFRTESQAG